jgi:hypothetical protein
MHRLVGLLLLPIAFSAEAIVIRDDVPDLQYRLAADAFPALADLPGEGHGVLIAPRWVVTAAHAVSWQSSVDLVVVGGAPRAVVRVVVHPGYRKPPQDMIDTALASGAWDAFFAFLASTDDLALIELRDPVSDVLPTPIFAGDVLGKTVRIIGRGATGTGTVGHPLHGPNRTDLRQGYNRITESDDRWIGYVFDAPPEALPQEAASGSGDSGGPMLVAVGDEWHLAGLAAWKRAEVRGTEIRPGRYGERCYAVRLASYADWIATTMAENG